MRRRLEAEETAIKITMRMNRNGTQRKTTKTLGKKVPGPVKRIGNMENPMTARIRITAISCGVVLFGGTAGNQVCGGGWTGGGCATRRDGRTP